MHWLTRKQANDKNQLSAFLPWGMQNCKHMTRLNSLHFFWGHAKLQTKTRKTNKKQKQKNNPMSEALWPSRSSWFSWFSCFCLFFFVFLVLSFCMNVSLTWLPVCFCEHFAVLSLLTLPFPIIPHHERSAHAYSATPLDIIQMCMFFWFSHGLGTLPESYLKRWEKIQHSHDLKI